MPERQRALQAREWRNTGNYYWVVMTVSYGGDQLSSGRLDIRAEVLRCGHFSESGLGGGEHAPRKPERGLAVKVAAKNQTGVSYVSSAPMMAFLLKKPQGAPNAAPTANRRPIGQVRTDDGQITNSGGTIHDLKV